MFCHPVFLSEFKDSGLQGQNLGRRQLSSEFFVKVVVEGEAKKCKVIILSSKLSAHLKNVNEMALMGLDFMTDKVSV
jgi:hypothetical protein